MPTLNAAGVTRLPMSRAPVSAAARSRTPAARVLMTRVLMTHVPVARIRMSHVRMTGFLDQLRSPMASYPGAVRRPVRFPHPPGQRPHPNLPLRT